MLSISIEAGLPNITGTVLGAKELRLLSTTGAFSISGYGKSGRGQTEGNEEHELILDASLSNSIYSNSNTVTPKSLKTFMLVKY